MEEHLFPKLILSIALTFLGWCIGLVMIAVQIAVFAVILNLPLAGELRFLLVALWMFLIGINMSLLRITKLREKQLHYARLAVSQTVRDPESEKEWGNAISENVGYILAFLIPLCGVGVVLHYGIFGRFGEGWLFPWAQSRDLQGPPGPYRV
jgi:hypothetical protein